MTNVEVFLHNNPDVTAVVTYHICYSCTTQIEHFDDKVYMSLSFIHSYTTSPC